MTELQIKVLLLKDFLNNYEDFVIAAEFPFQFGERRADLSLLLDGDLYCYEIKGARDVVTRLEEQLVSYRRFFDYSFVVCEKENLTSVRKSIPDSVGIIMAEGDSIKQIRKSKRFKRHDKLVLADSLTMRELKGIAGKAGFKSKREACEYVAKKYSLKDLKLVVVESFRRRYDISSRLMRLDASSHLNADDVFTITKKPPRNLSRRG